MGTTEHTDSTWNLGASLLISFPAPTWQGVSLANLESPSIIIWVLSYPFVPSTLYLCLVNSYTSLRLHLKPHLLGEAFQDTPELG